LFVLFVDSNLFNGLYNIFETIFPAKAIGKGMGRKRIAPSSPRVHLVAN
jgi:hypothetical protein